MTSWLRRLAWFAGGALTLSLVVLASESKGVAAPAEEDESCQGPAGQDCSTDSAEWNPLLKTKKKKKLYSKCGDNLCKAIAGENCSTCPKDCKCPIGKSCLSGSCVSPCGDNLCKAIAGENCSTCPKDCKCPPNLECHTGVCIAPKSG